MASQETDKLNESSVSKSTDRRTALSSWQRLSYGVGHVLNDLVASMWFSYLLIFLHKVNNFDTFLAGNLMLIGQISDALFTPFVGLESDRTHGFCNLGRRKSWHIVGTICVVASFPFLFMRCINCANTESIYQLIYYAPFVVIFQFGWASVQISHLSFSSDFTPYKEERVTLQSIRNMFGVFANLSLFGVFALLFYIGGDSEIGKDDELGPADAPKFRNLALICIGIGVCFYIVFYIGTRDKKKKADAEKGKQASYNGCSENSETQSLSKPPPKMTWKDWLKEPQFLQLAVLYMCTRLFINVSQVYLPMYLTETIRFSKIYIALMPLFVYCSSFVFAVLSPFMNRYLGRKVTYLFGIVMAAASCVWMGFIPQHSHQVYGSAVLLGASGSVLLITALSMASDLIAANIESGAFVFGALSFTDKLSNGIAVELIQKFHPAVACDANSSAYYRYVISAVPGAAIGVALIAFFTLLPQNLGVRRNQSQGLDFQTDNEEGERLQCPCGQFFTPGASCIHCIISGPGVQSLCDGNKSSDDESDDESSSLMKKGLLNTKYDDIDTVRRGNGHTSTG